MYASASVAVRTAVRVWRMILRPKARLLHKKLQLRIVLLLDVGSYACNSHLCKKGQAEVWVEVFGKLLPFFSSAGRKGWALEKMPPVKAFGTTAEDTGMDCPRLGHSAKPVVSQLCCCLGEVGGVWIVEVSLA